MTDKFNAFSKLQTFPKSQSPLYSIKEKRFSIFKTFRVDRCDRERHSSEDKSSLPQSEIHFLITDLHVDYLEDLLEKWLVYLKEKNSSVRLVKMKCFLHSKMFDGVMRRGVVLSKSKATHQERRGTTYFRQFQLVDR